MSTRKPKTTKAKPKKNAIKAKRVPIASLVEKRGRGRPTDYRPEYAEQAKKLILLGVTDEEMADFFGVALATIYNWRKTHKDFLDPCVFKVVADAEVAHSAHQTATGYTYETDKVVGKGDSARVVTVKVHVPGNPTAQQHWLRNRRRKEWADTKQVEVGGPGSFDNMDQQELLDYIRAEQEAIGLFEAEPGSESIN